MFTNIDQDFTDLWLLLIPVHFNACSLVKIISNWTLMKLHKWQIVQLWPQKKLSQIRYLIRLISRAKLLCNQFTVESSVIISRWLRRIRSYYRLTSRTRTSSCMEVQCSLWWTRSRSITSSVTSCSSSCRRSSRWIGRTTSMMWWDSRARRPALACCTPSCVRSVPASRTSSATRSAPCWGSVTWSSTCSVSVHRMRSTVSARSGTRLQWRSRCSTTWRTLRRSI